LAPKVIAAVIGMIGIALLAFPDPMRKLVDSFGRIKPLGSAAHLAIENQKGLASCEPLPLGISIADGSGGETVTVAGLAEGTELSLGTASPPTYQSSNRASSSWSSTPRPPGC
jgi:hypothetical protein